MSSKTKYSTNTDANRYEVPIGQMEMGGRVRDILLAFVVITVPMTAFSVLLLALIYVYRVVQNDVKSNNFQTPTGSVDADFIYVHLSATTLTTVSSWSSTVAPLLLGFALGLGSYSVANSMLKASRDSDPRDLPTPFQFALMLRMLSSAGAGSIWRWFLYTAGWRGRDAQTRPLRSLVFATDTWLHFTTKTINFTQFDTVGSMPNVSFELLPQCYSMKTPYAGGCTQSHAAANTFLLNGESAFGLLSNLSTTGMVKSFVSSSKNTYAYIGMPPRPDLEKIDYSAQTWAVSTKCTPKTKECVPYTSGPMAPYRCPFAFYGNILTNDDNHLDMAYFTDSSATNNDTTSSTTLGNPYYFAAAASVNQNLPHNTASLVNDTGIEIGTHGSVIFVVLCSSTVLDVQYSSVNGSLTRFLITPSNQSVVNIVQGSQQYTRMANNYLQQAAALAAWSSLSAQELTDRWGAAYSIAALSVASSATAPAPALEAQARTQMLVARVPKAPLFCLIGANMLIVTLGIVLTVRAFIAIGNHGAGEIQARLDITALAAAHFEPQTAGQPVEGIEQLFDEKSGLLGKKIGFVQSEQGGWIVASGMFS